MYESETTSLPPLYEMKLDFKRRLSSFCDPCKYYPLNLEGSENNLLKKIFFNKSKKLLNKYNIIIYMYNFNSINILLQ